MNHPTSTITQPTALITGASSGIGAAFARRLARDGYDLILVARRKEKMDALAAEIRAQASVNIEVIPADLAQSADVARLAERIAACENLALLVNNAGFGSGRAYFAEADIQNQLDMFQVHVAATMHLSRAALPGMIARRAGAIINVSSIAAFVAGSGSVSYHATKACLLAFSEALQLELRGTGVRLALCPGYTITEFHDSPAYAGFRRSIPGFLWMTADQVVAGSLDDLRRGKGISVPGIWYKIGVAVLTHSFTRPLVRGIVARIRSR